MSAAGRRQVVPFVPAARPEPAPVAAPVEARAFVEHHRHPIGVCSVCRQPLALEDDRYSGACLDPHCEGWLTPARKHDRWIWDMHQGGMSSKQIARALGVGVPEALSETVRVLLGEEKDGAA